MISTLQLGKLRQSLAEVTAAERGTEATFSASQLPALTTQPYSLAFCYQVLWVSQTQVYFLGPLLAHEPQCGTFRTRMIL